MAPPNSQKRVKGVQIFRPFVFGTVAKPFDDERNPKPEGTPADHTHSWTVFVKGVDDVDITYWLKKVQFKLHESIPNPLRTVEAVAGQPFQVSETGWGEFEMSIKLHYVPESLEKPQTLWHSLRLHPYGTDEQKKSQAHEVIAWSYEEQIFNEPYEAFFEILTSPNKGAKGKLKEKMSKTALVPLRQSPRQPFSTDTEQLEIKRLKDAQAKVDEMTNSMSKELKKKESQLAALRI